MCDSVGADHDDLRDPAMRILRMMDERAEPLSIGLMTIALEPMGFANITPTKASAILEFRALEDAILNSVARFFPSHIRFIACLSSMDS
jgi:hypothetical protein